jgi:hypothetical protein
MKNKFNWPQIIFFVFLGIIAAYFCVWHAKLVGPLAEPAPKTYISDEMFYLKTFYSVERGKNFYTSLMQADTERGGKMKPDVFTWRWPTIFYLWSTLAKNGAQILYLFWYFVFFSWVSIYLILRKFVNFWFAVTGVLIVILYFLDAVYYKTSFLFTEWWGWFFLIFGLAFFIYRKKYPAWIFFLLSAATRELMIIPIIIYFFIAVLSRKNRIFFLTLIGSFLILFFIHKHFVAGVMRDQSSFNLSQALSRIHVPTKTELFKMFSFSMRQYPFAELKIHLALALLSLFCFIKLLFIKAPCGLIYIILSGWSLALFLPFISGSYNDYWGITFMPSVLMILPLFFYKKTHENNR